MTTVPHNPVTDGPLVMRLDDDEGNPQAFDAVQVRILSGPVSADHGFDGHLRRIIGWEGGRSLTQLNALVDTYS